MRRILSGIIILSVFLVLAGSLDVSANGAPTVVIKIFSGSGLESFVQTTLEDSAQEVFGEPVCSCNIMHEIQTIIQELGDVMVSEIDSQIHDIRSAIKEFLHGLDAEAVITPWFIYAKYLH